MVITGGMQRGTTERLDDEDHDGLALFIPPLWRPCRCPAGPCSEWRYEETAGNLQGTSGEKTMMG
jgi:hypothetical protein